MTALVDVEELLIQGMLRLNADVIAQVGTRVYTVIPAEPTYPLVQVRRMGGQLVFSHHAWMDRCRIQWDAFGDTKKATWRVADAIRRAFIDGQATTYAPMGRVDAVTETIGPRGIDDKESDRVHVVGEMLVYTRPLSEDETS